MKRKNNISWFDTQLKMANECICWRREKKTKTQNGFVVSVMLERFWLHAAKLNLIGGLGHDQVNQGHC